MQLFTVSEYIAFSLSLYSVILTLSLSFQLRTFVCALLTLGATAPSLAVVHGIVPPPPLGSNSLPSSSNTGYRYNGPAHKYLPAASAPATEAVTTTGHWQPNALQVPSLEQQLPYEHVYSSTPAPEEQQQGQGYNGPYSMQYYEGEQQQQHSNRPQQHQQQYQQQYDSSREQLSSNSWQQQPPRQQQQLLHSYWQQQQHLPGNAWKQQQLDAARQQQLHLNLNLDGDSDNDNSNELNPFQFATNHKVAAAPATAGHAVASYALSAGTHSPRPVELDVRDVGLMTQALPEPHQQQLFAAPASYEQQLGGSSSGISSGSYVQMQSHSYELPPSISSSYSSGSSTAQREYPTSSQQHRQQQQHAAAAAEYATTGQPYPESNFFHGSSASSSPSHSSHSSQSSHAYPSSHSDSHSNYPSSYPSHSSYPTPSHTSSHSSYPSLSYAPPSREFQAPYYWLLHAEELHNSRSRRVKSEFDSSSEFSTQRLELNTPLFHSPEIRFVFPERN